MITESLLLVLATLVGLVLLLRRYSNRRESGRPHLVEAPCPGRYPLLGSILHVRHPLYKFLNERYPKEPIVRLHFGGQRVYCLNSTAAVREAYVNQADIFSGRPHLLGDSLVGDIGGLVFIDGPVWRNYRRFTLKTLRDFGFGKSFTEQSIIEEIQIMREQIESKPAGHRFESTRLLGVSMSNVICRFLFGRRLASEDPRFDSLQNIFARLTQEKDNISELFALFIVLTLCGGRERVALRVLQFVPAAKRVFDSFLSLLSYCRNLSTEHRATFAPDCQPKDYIEAHMLHCSNKDSDDQTNNSALPVDTEENHDKNSRQSTNDQVELQDDPKKQQQQPWVFNDTRLCLAMADLIVAGSDTTSTTIRWAMLLLHQNPSCYRLAAEEVGREIGFERHPSMKDRLVCHYLQACIDEIHRCASLVPLGLLHRCTEDTRLLGYDIPKDSLTLANQYNINNNPEVYPEPDKFRPERFLDAEGRYSPCEHLMPFSIGKRACLGESLARMELFLFIAGFLQRYERIEVESDTGEDLTPGAEIRTTPGDIRAPPPFSLRFYPR